ncbi:MAG: RNA polymerase sigma factor [Oligoflexia bacterium]|nr:RNA polymerase sigma factor [Oligoflexia bacterium]
MLAFQQGDEMAFEQLYQRIRRPVFSIAWRMLGDAATAEDAAQDILIKVYKSRHSYRPRARFRTWLYRVAVNHCSNERSRAWRRRETSDEGTVLRLLAPPSSDPVAQTQGSELARAIQTALAALPPRQRAAVVLARFEGCTMAELATAMDVSTASAKVLLHRGRSRLLELLQPHLGTTARNA